MMFDLTQLTPQLPQTKSILNSIKVKENIHLKNLRIINQSEILNVDDEYNEKLLIQKYFNIHKFNKGIITYESKFIDNKNNHYGRAYPEKIGLVSLRRKLKNTLIRNNNKFNYIDLDIKNCIPTICLNIAKKFKNEIDEYINKHISLFSNELQMMGYDDDEEDEEVKKHLTIKPKYLTATQKTKFKTLEKYINNRDEILKTFLMK